MACRLKLASGTTARRELLWNSIRPFYTLKNEIAFILINTRLKQIVFLQVLHLRLNESSNH